VQLDLLLRPNRRILQEFARLGPRRGIIAFLQQLITMPDFLLDGRPLLVSKKYVQAGGTNRYRQKERRYLPLVGNLPAEEFDPSGHLTGAPSPSSEPAVARGRHRESDFRIPYESLFS
jgi:hypothetical protein